MEEAVHEAQLEKLDYWVTGCNVDRQAETLPARDPHQPVDRLVVGVGGVKGRNLWWLY